MNRQCIAHLLILVACGAAAPLVLCHVSRAADKSTAVTPESSAARLLEMGGRYSPSALDKLREFHKGLPARVAEDARVRYAWGLVLTRQHCHREALLSIEGLVAEQPEALHLWRAKIWTEIVLHKDREALTDMRTVAELLGKQPVAGLPAAEADEWYATVGFLGRAFGFIEGARLSLLPADAVRRTKQEVLEKLGDERAGFDENAQAAAGKFAAARATSEELRAKRIAERMNKQEEYGKQKKAIDEAETNLDSDAKQIKSETKSTVGQIDRSAESLQRSIAACQLQVNDAQLAIQSVELRLGQLNGTIPYRGTCPNGGNCPSQGTYSSAMTSFNRGGGMMATVQLNNQLLQLAATQYMLQQQLVELNQQMQFTLARREQSLDKAGQSTEELQTKAEKLKHEEKKLQRAEQTETKRIAAERSKNLLTSQTPFASFEPFPFETEKLRVLAKATP